MESVLNEVRNDAHSRKVDREYIFVASRVSQLDDEHRKLEAMLKRFQEALKYSDSNFAQIHNYDSLALIDQDVFVCSRPRTRLASEYKSLAKMIKSRNVLDEDGASAFIDDLLGRPDIAEAHDIDINKLELIPDAHKANPQIMHNLALIYYLRRDLDLATLAIDAAYSAIDPTSRHSLIPARICWPPDSNLSSHGEQERGVKFSDLVPSSREGTSICLGRCAQNDFQIRYKPASGAARCSSLSRNYLPNAKRNGDSIEL